VTADTPKPSAGDIKRFRAYLQDEIDGVFFYRTLASIEDDPQLAEIYRKMAETEERHLRLWQSELAQAGERVNGEQPSWRARTLMWVARRFGPELVLPVIRAHEAGADVEYASDPTAAAALLPADERRNARIFSGLLSRPSRGLSGNAISRIESRHRSLGGGNALRAAVLGANDGLTSNLALIMGVAGANPGQSTVVLAGIAGLLAGSFSMALGEWISVTSSREAAEAQLAEEREELLRMPEAEREELALIYQAKGLSEEDARSLADRIMADPETALDTLAREELGIVPSDLGSPWAAASASFSLFAMGAVLPVLPFLFMNGALAVALSAVLAGAGLFGLGALITLLTGRQPLFSGMRQLVLGLVVAAITYGIGAMIGGATGI
jgi:VIT1/CCC1 family predicted Fe2+/Mn2+ transporter